MDADLIDLSKFQVQNSDAVAGPDGSPPVNNITAPNMSQKPTPAALRSLNHFLKLGQDHLKIDPIISYWCFYYAAEKGLILDKSSEGRVFIESILKWLEYQNVQHKDEDAIVNSLVAEAYMENYILNLMLRADDLERSLIYNMTTVKLLYTIGFLCETLQCFHDEMSADFLERMNYSKWRAAYIRNRLKMGGIPHWVDSSVQEQEPVVPAGLDMNIPTILNEEELSEITHGHGNVNGNICRATESGIAGAAQAHSFSHPVNIIEGIPKSTQGLHRQVTFDEMKRILEAQKFATIAASSLDYKDIDTAKEMMKKALGVLENIKLN